MPLAPSPIVIRFQAAGSSMPKHARLRRAIIDAVQAGELPLGAKVMGERDLSAALGLSLGTTQKALGRLMDEGFLVRRQGHGTFVGSERRPIAGSWHFRFVPPEGGAELPVFAIIAERALVKEAGSWADALGADRKGYIMIRRCLDIGGKFTCASRLYLPATRFGKLLRIAENRITDTNLKALLAGEFSAPTLHSEGLATVGPLDADETALMGLPPGTPGLHINIVGRSFGRTPITFQRVAVPPTRWALRLDFNPPGVDGMAGSIQHKE
jgi:DNA-binding GntR family transcriptional regulator